MTRWLAGPAAVLVLALLGAGCGGSSKSTNTSTAKQQAPAGGATTQKRASGGASGKTVVVAMKNIQFQPRTITVKAGTTVKWVNRDSAPHDVTKTGGPGPRFKSGSGNLANGDTFTVTFNTPGRIDYICTIHQPGMKGTVIVK